MPDTPRSSRTIVPLDRPRRPRRAPSDPDLADRRAALAEVIPRRAGVSWWLGIVLAVGFAVLVTPAITADRWLLRFHAGTPAEPGTVSEKHAAPFTVRAPMFAGYDNLRIGGGVVVARGETVSRDEATIADAIAAAMPRGPVLYLAFFALIFVLAAVFTHHMRRSTKGRLVRVQVVSLAVIAVLAVAVKIMLLSTALSALVVPVAVLALVPTMVLDRIVGLATGVLAALVVSFLAPFDVGLAILLLVQAATAGLVVAERPKHRWLAALTAGLVTTLCTGATYLLLTYLTTGHAPELRDPLHSPWLAAAIGPAIAAFLAVPLIPIYQLLVGEITQGKLFALEDLGHPLLRQIAEQSPGTWQHSLMMANMAEIAANAIGASGRLVRVGAYFHDLGKSLSPKYFIENLEAGETSPHDQLPPEVSCDAIFAHVTDGIVNARKAGLHERIVDFMHMHHGNGVLEYFWAKCREQGNPHDFTIEDFRYPGHPPQSRETAILTICDAVEAASRTLKKPDAAAIDALVQRIVYGKLHLGQLDESGLSMSDLRRISDSLRETIRHANHSRIEYPWQKAGQDASASVMTYAATSAPPRLDSLDRQPRRDTAGRASIPPPADGDEAFAATADVKRPAGELREPGASSAPPDAGASDAVKIRAGTARNASSAPPVRAVEDQAAREPDEARPLARQPEPHSPPESERGGPGPARNDRRAHGAGQTARGIERSELPVREPAPAPMIPITIPGRAPGPLPPPPDLITPEMFDSEPPQAARNRAATLPPAPPHRPPTAPPPVASRRATSDPARIAGPPAPVDLDNAITNPPPIRRGPSGHPPVPSDPAQLAAALATTVSRGSSGPHRMPRPPEDAAPRPARHVDLDSAITNPPPLGAAGAPARHVDLDSAITNPPPFGAPPRTARSQPDLDNAITNPPPFGAPAPARRPTDLDDAITNSPPLGAPAAPSAVPATSATPVEVPGPIAIQASPDAPARASDAHADRDSARATQAPPDADARAEAAPPADLPEASASQASADAPEPAPHTTDVVDSATTDPEMASAPPAEPTTDLDTAIVSPPRTAGSAGAAMRSPGSQPPRTSGLADGDRRPRALETLRGHGDADATVALRPSASTPDAGAASRPGAGTAAARAASRLAALQLEDEARVTAARAATKPRRDDEARVTQDRRPAPAHDLDAGVTEPSLPILAIGDERRVDLALHAAPPSSAPPERAAGWASGLAARIDAALDSDEWNLETPVVPPTKAELRALLGQPDPTRQQPVDEIALLQRRAAELQDGGPPRRSPHPTTEVDPDDIEAAIELAPPARRPTNAHAIGVAKPKKSE